MAARSGSLSARSGGARGAAYRFVDRTAGRSVHRYGLRVISLDGSSRCASTAVAAPAP